MIRGATPTFVLELQEEIDLSAAANVYATFRRGAINVTKSGDELTIDGREVSVYLDQAETLLFPAGADVEIQLNWTYEDGGRAASEIANVRMEKNLLPKVLK